MKLMGPLIDQAVALHTYVLLLYPFISVFLLLLIFLVGVE